MKINLAKREFLQKLIEEAEKEMRLAGSSKWKSVFRRLAEVVCELDAYIVRLNLKYKRDI